MASTKEIGYDEQIEIPNKFPAEKWLGQAKINRSVPSARSVRECGRAHAGPAFIPFITYIERIGHFAIGPSLITTLTTNLNFRRFRFEKYEFSPLLPFYFRIRRCLLRFLVSAQCPDAQPFPSHPSQRSQCRPTLL